MKNKKWIITVALAIALITALGTTVAFAADDESEFGNSTRNWFGKDERPPLSQDHLDHLVEEGKLTQQEADSILSGESNIFDYLDQEDRPERQGRQIGEERLARLVEDGKLTQDQSDSIIAGDSDLFDFLDPEDNPERQGHQISEEHLNRLVEDGKLTQQEADSILAGESSILDCIDSENRPDGMSRSEKSEGRGSRGSGQKKDS